MAARNKKPPNSLNMYLADLWQKVIAPSAKLTDTVNQRRARLLATMMLIFNAINLPALIIAQTTIYRPGTRFWVQSHFYIWLGVTILGLIVYGLARTRHYRLGVWLFTSLLTLAVALTVFTEGGWTDYTVGFLVPVLLAGLWLGLEGASFFAILSVVLTLISLWLYPLSLPEDTITPPLVTLIICGLLVVFVYHRNQIEADRRTALQKANRAYRTLSDCNHAIVRFKDERKLVQEICRIIVDVGGYRLAWVGFTGQEGQAPIFPIAHAGHEEGYLETIRKTWADTERWRGPTGKALHTGIPSIIQRTASDPAYEMWREEALKRQFHAFIALPLLDDKHTFGVINIYQDKPDAFDAEEIDLLVELSNDLAYALVTLRMQVKGEQAEAALRESEQRFRMLVEQSPFAFQIFAPDGTLIRVNKAWEEMWNAKAEDVIGKFNPLHDEQIRVSGLLPLIKRVFGGEVVHIPDTEYDPAQSGMPGKKRWVRTHPYHITTQDKLLNVVLLNEDVTERKKAEAVLRNTQEHLEALVKQRTADLETAYESLKELDRMKDEFVSNVSHELRSPITSFKLHLDLLEMQTEKRAFYMETLRRETERLETLVEDLLYLSRLDQKRTSFHFEAVNLNNLVETYITDRQAVAQSCELNLSFDPSSDLPAAQADPGQLGQVLSILLSNAFNYTPAGGKIVVRTHSRIFDDQQWIGFSVNDNGLGIDPNEQPHLFARFFRGQAGYDSGAPGTGLGLSIARAIVRQHKGQIKVESEGVAGKGATFSVWLPVKKVTNHEV